MDRLEKIAKKLNYQDLLWKMRISGIAESEILEFLLQDLWNLEQETKANMLNTLVEHHLKIAVETLLKDSNFITEMALIEDPNEAKEVIRSRLTEIVKRIKPVLALEYKRISDDIQMTFLEKEDA